MSTLVRRMAFRGKEEVKIGLRKSLNHANLDLVRNPFARRITATLTWLGIDTVLDVGANIGQYASALRANGFKGRILSFEPMSDEYTMLRRRSERDALWTTVHAALGAEVGQVRMNVAGNSYSSSLLPIARAHLDAAPGSDTVRTENVRMSTVREVLNQYVVDPTSTLLKIDTQGYEGMVLNGAGPALRTFAAIQIEMSYTTLYTGQEHAADLTRRLVDMGYELHTLEPGLSDPRSGRTLQADGLFVRLS